MDDAKTILDLMKRSDKEEMNKKRKHVENLKV